MSIKIAVVSQNICYFCNVLQKFLTNTEIWSIMCNIKAQRRSSNVYR